MIRELYGHDITDIWLALIYHDFDRRKCRTSVCFRFLCTNFDGHLKVKAKYVNITTYAWILTKLALCIRSIPYMNSNMDIFIQNLNSPIETRPIHVFDKVLQIVHLTPLRVLYINLEMSSTMKFFLLICDVLRLCTCHRCCLYINVLNALVYSLVESFCF